MLPFRYRTTFYDHIIEPSIVNFSDSCPYELLAEHMKRAGITMSPADAHGFACGLIVLAVPDGRLTWEKELLADAGNDVALEPAAHALLHQQFERLEQTMAETEYALVLCLPDDDSALAGRVAALRDWCRGFLFGLGFAGGPRLDSLNGEAQEAIKDLTEITRLDADASAAVEDDATNENALMELREYVRVAVYLVKQELQTPTGEVNDAQ